MGCGSSTSNPAPAAKGGKPTKSDNPPLNAVIPTDKQQQQPPHQQPALRTKTSATSASHTSQPAPFVAASPTSLQQPQQTPSSSPPSNHKPPAALQLHPSASTPASPSPLKAPNQLAPLKNVPPSPTTGKKVMCDAEPSHVATLHCLDCEENFCQSCDSTVHSRKKTMSHTRKPLLSLATSLSSPRAPLTQLQPPSANTNSPKLRPKEKERDKDKADEKKPGQHTPKVQKQPSLLQKQPSLLQKQASLPVRQEDKYIHAVPIEKLRSLTGDQLNIIWAQYDSDNSGSLDRRELKLLATDCIARTIRMIEEEFKRQNPSISDSSLRDAVAREAQYIMPGASKGSKDDIQKHMVKMLVRKLDVNGDGLVTKTELMMQWNSFSKDLFQMRTEESLECSIM